MDNALKLNYAKYNYDVAQHNIETPVSGEIEYIDIERIRPNPYQPRKTFNKTSLSELADSIKAYGVLQPVNVRKIGGGLYELVAGERRLRAAQLAGLRSIPCIPVTVNDNDSATIALIENLQREDLNFIEEAEGYTALICEHGMTQEELARKIGKSQSTVANKVRLLKLSPAIRNVILENHLTERHARAFLKIEDEILQNKILKEVCLKGLNVKKTEDLIDTYISGEGEIISVVENVGLFFRRDPLVSGRPQVKRVIKDLRIFVNTIRESIELLKESGVTAKAAQFDRGDYLEFIIRIPKRENSL